MATTPTVNFTEALAAKPSYPEQIDDLLKLQKAAQKISSILDLDQLIHKITHEVALSFGCLEATIYLHDEARGELVLEAVCGCTRHHKGDRKKIGKEGMVGHVAASGQMHYAPDVRQDPYYVACEEGTLSEVAIPLHVEGKLVGVFSASHTELDAFSRPQLRLLQAFCSHVAVAVQNARRFQSERTEREAMDREAQEARTIQQALLPKSSPFIPGYVISGLSVPARAVGGDWYDFIPFADGRWGLVLADVSGKGTAAALLMSATRGMLRSLAEACCSPGEVLTKLNHLMTYDFPAGKFVTMVYAVLDPVARTVIFSNAGHLLPLYLDVDGARFLDVERGLPLGVGCGDYSETQVVLTEGSRLIFYSDGITEAVNPDDEEFGLDRLAALAATPAASAMTIAEGVRTFANGAGVRDDASVVFVGVGTARVPQSN